MSRFICSIRGKVVVREDSGLLTIIWFLRLQYYVLFYLPCTFYIYKYNLFLKNVPTCIVFPVPQYIVAYFSSDIIGIIFSVSSPLLLTRVSHLSNSSYIELFLFSL